MILDKLQKYSLGIAMFLLASIGILSVLGVLLFITGREHLGGLVWITCAALMIMYTRLSIYRVNTNNTKEDK